MLCIDVPVLGHVEKTCRGLCCRRPVPQLVGWTWNLTDRGELTGNTLWSVNERAKNNRESEGSPG